MKGVTREATTVIQMTQQMLPMPRGLWEDFETTIIIQDTQFLSWLAGQIGKPKAEVINLCLGKRGTPQAVLVGMVPEAQCPWYDCHGAGLWRRCQRPRLTPTGPCQLHDRPRQGAKLTVSAEMVYPYLYNDRIYWTADEPDAAVFREDGTIETEFEILFFTNSDGERVPYIKKGKGEG
jgi:hypothetical protein